MITVYAITCPKCKTTIFSRSCHDFRSCPCGAMSIDGGFDYTKVNFDPKRVKPPRPFPVEINQTIVELYQDWNTNTNNYGLIQPALTSPETPVMNDPWRCLRLARPIRSLKKALQYIVPRRLTLKSNPRIHAWLWWNF